METIEQAPAPAEQSPVVEAQEPLSNAVDDLKPTHNEDDTPKNEDKQEQPRRSRREALEKAFKDVGDTKDEGGADKGVKEAAKDTPADKPEAQKTAEKATEAKTDGPERGPDGKFVAKEAENKPTDADKAKEAPQTAKSPLDEPPARFSEAAKAAWGDAPEAIRAEAQRAIRETEQGIQQYQEQMAPIKPFLQMANNNPTALAGAMQRYVNTENMLRQNPVQGFTEIARNMGLSPQQVGKMLLGQEPGQGDPRDGEINSLRQQVQQLMQAQGQITQSVTQQREQAVMSQVEQFAKANPRFEELSEEIASMLQTGYAKDLQDAYEKADRMNPAPAPVVQEAPPPAQPAQTRPARSVTGAPSSGSNPAQSKPSQNRKEALERAMRRAGF